jgi:hypothetical protein
MRSNDFERVIIHYMNPHQPYTSSAIKENRVPPKEWRLPFMGDSEADQYKEEAANILDGKK